MWLCQTIPRRLHPSRSAPCLNAADKSAVSSNKFSASRTCRLLFKLLKCKNGERDRLVPAFLSKFNATPYRSSTVRHRQ